MSRLLLAKIVYITILAIMVISAIWVMADARKRGRPWGESLVWGLFAGWFLGLGPIFYIFWKKKFKQ